MTYSLTENEADLYAAVRAGFVLKSTTLNQWCRQNGITLETARQTLAGLRRGDDADQLRRQLMQAAGVREIRQA